MASLTVGLWFLRGGAAERRLSVFGGRVFTLRVHLHRGWWLRTRLGYVTCPPRVSR